MAGRQVIHETFRIERIYAAAPSAVFAAFSTKEARSSWGDPGDLEPPEDDGDGEVSEFDFRVGGREVFSTKWQGTTYRYDARRRWRRIASRHSPSPSRGISRTSRYAPAVWSS